MYAFVNGYAIDNQSIEIKNAEMKEKN